MSPTKKGGKHNIEFLQCKPSLGMSCPVRKDRLSKLLSQWFFKPKFKIFPLALLVIQKENDTHLGSVDSHALLDLDRKIRNRPPSFYDFIYIHAACLFTPFAFAVPYPTLIFSRALENYAHPEAVYIAILQMASRPLSTKPLSTISHIHSLHSALVFKKCEEQEEGEKKPHQIRSKPQTPFGKCPENKQWIKRGWVDA